MDRLGGLAKYYNQVGAQRGGNKVIYGADAPQAKNTVLNVSEIEAKVSEATSDKPW